MNYVDGKSDSLTSAALWGGSFGALGSVAADAIPAFSAAINQTKVNGLGTGWQNFYSGLAESNGQQLGGASRAAVFSGTQLGNLVGSLPSFIPGDSDTPAATFSNQTNVQTFPGADGGFLMYPNQPNTNQVQRAYSK